jgi:hypothetical protein
MFLVYSGNITQAKSVCASLVGEGSRRLCEGSQADLPALQLSKSTAFTEEIQIDEETYLYNPNTGEIARKQDADIFSKTSKNLLQQLMAEEEKMKEVSA